MTVQNAEIADQFEHLADLLELDGANPFRVRANRNAARFIRGHGRSLADLLDEGADLAELPGIGEDLAGKIATLVRTGRLPLLEQLTARVPAPLVAMTRIEGLGPKRAKALYRALRIRSLEDLARAARSGRIRELPGFGAGTEQLLAQRAARAQGERRMRLADAEQVARPLVAYLRGLMRRLGKDWRRLHRLVYAAAPLAVVHYVWLIKADIPVPLLFGALVGVLLLVRIPDIKRKVLTLIRR